MQFFKQKKTSFLPDIEKENIPTAFHDPQASPIDFTGKSIWCNLGKLSSLFL
jgi:hypothetical protein